MLVWAVYYLCKHPKVVERMLKEIDEVLGENEIKKDDIDKLVYFHFFVTFVLSQVFIILQTLKPILKVFFAVGGVGVKPSNTSPSLNKYFVLVAAFVDTQLKFKLKFSQPF